MEAYAININKLLDEGHRVAVIVGGGSIAREYIETARSLGLSRNNQDTIAIHASRLNAKLIGFRLGSSTVSVSVDGMVASLKTHKVALMGGLRPGITTDTVAALVAEAWHSDLIIKASDQEGVYTADPRRVKGAKLLHSMTHAQLAKVLGGQHAPGIHSIVDPVAVQRIAELRIRLVVINGFNPENVMKVVSGEDIGTTVS